MIRVQQDRATAKFRVVSISVSDPDAVSAIPTGSR